MLNFKMFRFGTPLIERKLPSPTKNPNDHSNKIECDDPKLQKDLPKLLAPRLDSSEDHRVSNPEYEQQAPPDQTN